MIEYLCKMSAADCNMLHLVLVERTTGEEEQIAPALTVAVEEVEEFVAGSEIRGHPSHMPLTVGSQSQ